MRITNAIAEEVAEEMVKEKASVLNELKHELRKFVRDEYYKSIPNEIIELSEKGFKDWFNEKCSVKFAGTNGLGFNTVWFLNDEYLPAKCNSTSFTPSADVSEKIVKLQNEISKKEFQLSNLKNEIRVTLKSLSTYKRIEVEFNEAFEFLPTAKISTSLQVNISSLRKKLKN